MLREALEKEAKDEKLSKQQFKKAESEIIKWYSILWTIILVIVAIIIIVLLLKYLFAIFVIAPFTLHYDIQTLNFVVSDLKLSSQECRLISFLSIFTFYQQELDQNSTYDAYGQIILAYLPTMTSNTSQNIQSWIQSTAERSGAERSGAGWAVSVTDKHLKKPASAVLTQMQIIYGKQITNDSVTIV